MEMQRPSRSVVFLRCPEELREQLAAAADSSLRSLNSEIVYRLRASLEREPAQTRPAA